MSRLIILVLVFSACGYSMTKEELIDIKIEEQLEEHRLKERKKCRVSYWEELNSIADSLLAISAIGQTDCMVVKFVKPRPVLDYQPRFNDTIALNPLFKEKELIK